MMLLVKSRLFEKLVKTSQVSQCYKFSTIKKREPYHPKGGVTKGLNSLEEALAVLKNGSNIFMQGAAATPTVLANSVCDFVVKSNLEKVFVHHIHTEGDFPFTAGEAKKKFRSNSLFTGGALRKPIDIGVADYTPVFLSDIPKLFRRGIIPLDAALISITPPDRHGFCSIGPSVDVTRAALETADLIIAQENKHLPYTRGDAQIHVSHIDFRLRHDAEVHYMAPRGISEAEHQIGKLIAENLVADGATLQTGIGSIPDAVLAQLTNHRDLGVHTEMFSDGLVDLVASGAVSNVKKKLHRGRIVSSFVIGTKKVFDFLDGNPFIDMMDIQWVNSPLIIAQNPIPTAINSCIEVDLTGQVCADSIGTRIYSGFGGQVDFISGAGMSVDGLGKPIIALASSTKRNESKIVPALKKGAGVVTTRANVHYVVTEYGIAHIFGKNLRQRAHALIGIAHPDHREALEKAAFERLKCMPSPD